MASINGIRLRAIKNTREGIRANLYIDTRKVASISQDNYNMKIECKLEDGVELEELEVEVAKRIKGYLMRERAKAEDIRFTRDIVRYSKGMALLSKMEHGVKMDRSVMDYVLEIVLEIGRTESEFKKYTKKGYKTIVTAEKEDGEFIAMASCRDSLEIKKDYLAQGFDKVEIYRSVEEFEIVTTE